MEKQSATTIGWGANLRTDMFTIDCTDSLRAGTKIEIGARGTEAMRAVHVEHVHRSLERAERVRFGKTGSDARLGTISFSATM